MCFVTLNLVLPALMQGRGYKREALQTQAYYCRPESPSGHHHRVDTIRAVYPEHHQARHTRGSSSFRTSSAGKEPAGAFPSDYDCMQVRKPMLWLLLACMLRRLLCAGTCISATLAAVV